MRPQGLHEPEATAPVRERGASFAVVPSPEPVALVGLPPTAWPQVVESGLGDPRKGTSVIATPHELTLVVPWGSAPVARGLFPGLRVDGPFRLLTLDASPPDAARLTRALTALEDAGVPARANASVDRDHVLVREEDADRAVSVLRILASPPARADASPPA